MGCDNCDRLRRQVRELTEEIKEYEASGHTDDDLFVRRLAKTIGIKPQAAKILSLLMDHPGRLTSTDLLIEAAEYEGEATNPNDRRFKSAICVNISSIRRRLESKSIHKAIENFYGTGYVLSKEAAAKIRALL